MKIATTTRKIRSARSALLVISLPHDELTRLTLTSSIWHLSSIGERLTQLGSDLLGLVADLDFDERARIGGTTLQSCAIGRQAVVAQHGAGVVDRETVDSWNIPRHSALEVDPEVEALAEQRDHGGDQEHGREPDPDLATSDEVDRGLPLEQAPDPGPGDRGTLDCGVVAHDDAPNGEPTAGFRPTLSNHFVSASRYTAGRVKK